MRTIWQRAGLALAFGATSLSTPSLAQEQAAANPVNECTLSTRSTAEIDAMLRQNGVALVDYPTFCEGLASTRTGIDAAGYAASHGDKSVALVILRLYDIEGGTSGTETSFSFVEEPGNDEAARTSAYSRAYNLALGEMERDRITFVASVVQEMGRLDGLYREGVVPAVAPAQQPCAMTYRANQPVEEAITARRALPDFPAYNVFCEALRVRGAGLELIGAQLLVDGRLQTVAGVSVYDLATGLQGGFHGYANATTLEATEADRQAEIWTTLQSAMEGMAANSADAFAALDNVLARDRAFYPVGQ